MPEDADHVITAANVVDMATLKQFRRQNADMPEHLKRAIGHIAGGYVLNKRHISDAAKSLGGGGG